MADLVYVDNTVAPGGAGTIGDPYSTWDEAWTNEVGTLGDDMRIIVTGGDDDTSNPVLSGWTFDGHTMTVEAASGDEFLLVADGTRYRLAPTSGTVLTLSNATASHLIIKDVQIVANAGSATQSGISITDADTTLELNACLLKRATQYGNSQGIDSGSQPTIYLINSVLHNWNRALSFGSSSSPYLWSYNCLYKSNYYCGYINDNNNRRCVFKNNVFYNSTTRNFYAGEDDVSTDSGYNVTDASTMEYDPDTGGTGDDYGQAFTFDGDYKLSSSDVGAKELGQDLSSDSDYAFSIDALGTPRTVPWDCGPHEISAGGGTPVEVIGTNAVLTFSGAAGIPTAGLSLVGTSGSLTLSGASGTPAAGFDVDGSADTLTLTGYAGTVTIGGAVELVGNAGTLTLTGQTGLPHSGLDLTGSAATLTLTGQIGVVNAGGVAVVGQAGTLTLTGHIGTVTAGAALTGDNAMLTITGNVGIVNVGDVLTWDDPGVISISDAYGTLSITPERGIQ